MTPFGLVRRISVSKERAPVSGLKVPYSLFHRNVANTLPDYTAPQPEALCLNIHQIEYHGTEGLRKIAENKLRTHISFTEVFQFLPFTNGGKLGRSSAQRDHNSLT